MNLLVKQIAVKDKITAVAKVIGLDPALAAAVALTESSLGEQKLSPTGCRGAFGMSHIAMEELYRLMKDSNEDWYGILCGIAFLLAMLHQWKTVDDALAHYCDPKDRDFYVGRVKGYMEVFKT